MKNSVISSAYSARRIVVSTRTGHTGREKFQASFGARCKPDIEPAPVLAGRGRTLLFVGDEVTSLKSFRFLKDKLETPYVVSYSLTGSQAGVSLVQWRHAGQNVRHEIPRQPLRVLVAH